MLDNILRKIVTDHLSVVQIETTSGFLCLFLQPRSQTLCPLPRMDERQKRKRAWKRGCSFSWVCPVIDHEFRHDIVKVHLHLQLHLLSGKIISDISPTK